MEIRYTVRCEFHPPADADLPRRWLAWLQDEHLAAVLAAGADAVEVVRMEGETPTYEVRYAFALRAAFDCYLAEHAARLRAEGLQRFPLEWGLTYQRSWGEVIAAR